jgi:Domain of Unknown Function (DUF1080)
MLKIVIATLAGLGAIAAASAVFAAGKDPVNQLTREERKAGWRLLFDGKTTSGWRGYKQTGVPAGWRALGGALTRAAKGGDIVTVDQFQDFELAIEWRIAEGGNSGIMYRVSESEDNPFLTGPEYQVLDDARHPDATRGIPGNRKSGSLYDVYPPVKDVVRPAGQWNQAKIVVAGNHIEHWLNGEKVVEAEIGSADWQKRIAASKWAKVATFARAARGFIDLQDHGDEVAYRNIKLRVLGPAGAHHE